MRLVLLPIIPHQNLIFSLIQARKRAMADPEVQKILNDPAMRMILEQMQNDPNAIQVR